MGRKESIYLKIKERMKEYDSDLEGAIRRSERITNDEMVRAIQCADDWEKLKGFGVII